MAKKPDDLLTIRKNRDSSSSELDEIISVVVEQIKSRMAEFTPRQRDLAGYIIQHPESIGFLTINELAKKAGVSEASIVRFCHIIGYRGYAHLGREIQENIHSQLGTEGRFTMTRGQSGSVSSDSTSAFERVVAHEMDNLAKLSKSIKKTDFYRVVEWMAAADRIVISGCMGSGSLAKYFGYMLAKILPRVEVLDAPGTIPFKVLSSLGSESLVFLIAFPRYPRPTVEIGHLVAGKRTKIVAITDSHLSPLVSVADVSFLISVGITSFVDSYAAPVTFINALVTELSESNSVETQKRLREFDKYASEMQMFVKFTAKGKSIEAEYSSSQRISANLEERQMKTYVTDFLDNLGIPYKIKRHNRSVFTSEDAARERGVRLSQIVKTMLLTGKNEFTMVALLPGHKKLDLKNLKKISGQKSLEFMDRKAIENRFGLVVGAVAPVGPALEGLPVYVDPSIFEEEVIDISSGDPIAGVELNRDNFRKLLKHATVAEITKVD